MEAIASKDIAIIEEVVGEDACEDVVGGIERQREEGRLLCSRAWEGFQHRKSGAFNGASRRVQHRNHVRVSGVSSDRLGNIIR